MTSKKGNRAIFYCALAFALFACQSGGVSSTSADGYQTTYEIESVLGSTRDYIEMASDASFIATSTFGIDRIGISRIDGTGVLASPVYTTVGAVSYLAAHPGNQFLLVGRSNNGFQVGSLDVYKVESDSTLTLKDQKLNIGPIDCLKTSPDGKFVILCRPENQEYRYDIYSINATTGALTLSAQSVAYNDSNIGPFDRPRVASFTPNGSYFVVMTHEGSCGLMNLRVFVYSVNATTGALTQVSKVSPSITYSPIAMVISPDSKLVYFTTKGVSGIRVGTLDTNGVFAYPGNLDWGNYPPNWQVEYGYPVPNDLQVSSDGTLVWASQFQFGYTATFKVNASTGQTQSVVSSVTQSDADRRLRFIKYNSTHNKVYGISGAMRKFDLNGKFVSTMSGIFRFGSAAGTGALSLETYADEK